MRKPTVTLLWSTHSTCWSPLLSTMTHAQITVPICQRRPPFSLLLTFFTTLYQNAVFLYVLYQASVSPRPPLSCWAWMIKPCLKLSSVFHKMKVLTFHHFDSIAICMSTALIQYSSMLQSTRGNLLLVTVSIKLIVVNACTHHRSGISWH